jgi:UDP-GlcNAc:undecaprenyl-phosphate GlcNAc-1-phosphate transferase
MNVYYLTIFVFIFFLSVVLTEIARRLAIRFNFFDRPDAERKTHNAATPLFGGAAVFLAFFIALYFLRDKILAGNLEAHHWVGFFIGACFLMLGGFLDDKFNLRPSKQIIFPVLAIFSVIFGGVEIEKITNPFGGFFYPGYLSATIILLWLLGMMYTTKLLDGVDGLVSGVSAIGGFIIFLFTITTKYYQPDIGLAALVFSAACLGFLIFNWHPARIFLGEGGSLLLGYILGVLAIISGGKIAVALLIMGIPIMDVLWTILRRLKEGKNPFKFADKKHLHFRLLEMGLGARKTVLFYSAFSLIFGLLALFLQSKEKIFALVILALIMAGIVASFKYFNERVDK